MLPLASARTVLERCSAEMPVVSPCRTSTETVKAVPSGASFDGDHRVEAQAPRLGTGQRRADDAAGVADDERHLLRRAERGGDDEIALVLAVVVVGDDDDFAAGEGLDGLGDGMGHGVSLLAKARKSLGVTAPSCLAGDELRRFPRHPGGPSLQSWVIAPGDTPIAARNRRARHCCCLSQSANLMAQLIRPEQFQLN